VTAPLRVVLVDDEPLALRRLARLLTATGRVEIVGQAMSAEAGLAEAAGRGVDALFLDIQMPGLSGLQLARRLPSPGPMVVFTTAYDRHAVEAFEVNAVDYLLKPIERGRLDQALERLERRREDPGRAGLRDVLERLAESLKAPAFLERLASRVGERVELVDVGDVTHLVARDRAVYAVTAAREHLLDLTLAELERRLDPSRFFRVHRTSLVNLACVAEVHAHIGGRLIVRLRDPRRTELEVARDRARELKERLGI
jgi:two-component system LytT family response regulator